MRVSRFDKDFFGFQWKKNLWKAQYCQNEIMKERQRQCERVSNIKIWGQRNLIYSFRTNDIRRCFPLNRVYLLSGTKRYWIFSEGEWNSPARSRSFLFSRQTTTKNTKFTCHMKPYRSKKDKERKYAERLVPIDDITMRSSEPRSGKTSKFIL